MDVAKLYRIAVAARDVGVQRSTLKSAIDRGEVAVFESACGLPMVRLADVVQWAAQERSRGPKPKAATEAVAKKRRV